MNNIDKFVGMGNLTNAFLNMDWEANKTAKEDYKIILIISIIGTIVIMAACIGIMYLRFRVFGR